MSDKKNFEIDAESAITLEIDASGLNCPLPLLKAKQGLHQVEQGQFICRPPMRAQSVIFTAC